jgi:hypothetical protein
MDVPCLDQTPLENVPLRDSTVGGGRIWCYAGNEIGVRGAGSFLKLLEGNRTITGLELEGTFEVFQALILSSPT